MLTEREAKKICDTLLKLTKADDAVVSVRESVQSNQRFAANAFTTNGSSRERSFSVTMWIDKRQGSASGTEFDEAALRRAVEQAEHLAKLSPPDVEYLPTLGPQKYKPVKGYAGKTAELSPAWRAKQIGRILDECEDAKVVGAGLFRSGAFLSASATRNGNFEFERSTSADLSITARTPDGMSSGYGLHDHFDVEKLDVGGVSRRAIKKALTGQDAQKLAPGIYPVILEPQAVSDILGFFNGAFNARNADEGRSPMSAPGGKTQLGQAVFDSKINFYSDPWHPELPGSQSAQDGLPAEKLYLVRGGVVENLITSRFWAQKTGKQPTPGPVNSILESTGPTNSLDEMIAASDRALLVTRLWYIRMVSPRTQLLTGLTRDGVWLVENGKIRNPVRNFRFNQSVMQMLAPGNVEMIGKPVRTGGLFPALKLKEFTFSSESEAV
ncbi:MAG TPA: TldD/PmbA family protein [Verrucomicrobiae bacterium]|nr:TldD/PmbA family protein [Verrucomicrobiae bacterium]